MITHVVKRLAGDLPPDQPVLTGLHGDDVERINKADERYTYQVNPQRDNNPAFHRKVMTLLNVLFDNQEDYQDSELYRMYVKLKIGWVTETPVIDANGTHYMVKPLDFKRCKQEERELFWSLLKPFAAEQLGWDYVSMFEGGL